MIADTDRFGINRAVLHVKHSVTDVFWRDIMKCICGGEEIVIIRMDDDWAPGNGSIHIVNAREAYSEDTLRRVEDGSRPDIEVFFCLTCGLGSTEPLDTLSIKTFDNSGE